MITPTQYIIIGILIVFVIILILQVSYSYEYKDPRELLTKVVKRITGGPLPTTGPDPTRRPRAQLEQVIHTSRVDKRNILPTTVNVYSYYGSANYEQDMKLLQQVCHHGSHHRFTKDCYPLSTQDTTLMTVYDMNRIQSNLFYNIRPAIAAFAKQKDWYNLTAVILLFYHIILETEGVDGSLFLYPTYDSQGYVSSFKYALIVNTITKEVITYLTANQAFNDLNGTGSVSVPFPKMDGDLLQTFYYARSIPMSYRKSFSALMRHMINPLWDERATLLANYPDSTVDLPVDVGCKLMIPVIMAYYIYFSISYTNSNCE